jgi:hypothetical protein
MPATALKRVRPTLPDIEPQPQPLSTRALPVAVWEDHLLPKLTCKDAARLGCTCEALRTIVREHFKEDLGEISLKQLRAPLTAFPRGRAVTLKCQDKAWTSNESRNLSAWLREGGRGRHLATLVIRSDGRAASDFVHVALREGAFPSLTRVDANLEYDIPRASLTGGLLRGMHELHLTVTSSDVEPQLAALGLVRELPALGKLELEVRPDWRNNGPVQWPPFIPPSLKALSIELSDNRFSLFLLPALPSMLKASGAGLERLETKTASYFRKAVDDRLVHVVGVLRCCSPTLKVLDLAKRGGISITSGRDEEDEHQSRVERLHAVGGDGVRGAARPGQAQGDARGGVGGWGR